MAEINQFLRLADDIGLKALSVPTLDSIQHGGAAEFAGYIGIQADRYNLFIADIDLTLDFDAGAITATHGPFFLENALPRPVKFDGESDITDLDLDVRGNLRYDDKRLRVSVNLTGSLLGENSEGLVLPPGPTGENYSIRLNDDRQSNLASVEIVTISGPR